MGKTNRIVSSDSIAAFVRQERKRNGLTQAELADIAGVSDRFIRDVEHGKASIRLDALARLLSVFGARLAVERHHAAEDPEHRP